MLKKNIDILIHGHTHKCRDEQINGVRYLNPGPIYRGKPIRTYALLCIKTLEFKFFSLETAQPIYINKTL